MRLGPYETLSELGRGGMGVVLRARAPDGRLVAIKLLVRAGRDAAERFERERRLISTLTEADGFVPLVDHGVAAEGPFLVMPLCDGGTLRTKLESGPLAAPLVRELGVALARALGRAHARGIVHRDMKPENVLYTTHRGAEHGAGPLVADLGIAKHFTRDVLGGSQSVSLSRENELRGTAAYMAPEQLHDARTVGPAADVFALGAILYEALSGEPAFAGDSVIGVIEKIQKGTRTPLGRLCPAAPRGLVAAIERALATEAAKRPRDGIAFAALLAEEQSAPRRWPLIAAALVLSAGTGALATRALPREQPLAAPSGPPPPAPPPTPPPRTTPAAARAQAVALVEASKTAMKTGDVAASTARAEEAVKADPTCADAYCQRGQLRLVARKVDEGIADMDRAVELDPRHAAALSTRAVARKSTRTAEALVDAERATEADPTVAYGWFALADIRVIAGKPSEALVAVEKALEIDPRNPASHRLRGECLRRLGRLDEALEAARKALELSPRFARAFELEAEILIERHEPEKARAAAEQAVVLNERSPKAHAALGEALLQLERPDEALVALDRAIALDPATSSALTSRASIKAARKDHEGAIRDLDRALAVDPRRAAAWAQRGVSHYVLGRYGSALEDLDRALQLFPNFRWALAHRGLVKEKSNDLQGALADFSKLIVMSHDYSEGWRARARIHARLGHKKEALADARKALEIEPAHPEAADVRALIERMEKLPD